MIQRLSPLVQRSPAPCPSPAWDCKDQFCGYFIYLQFMLWGVFSTGHLCSEMKWKKKTTNQSEFFWRKNLLVCWLPGLHFHLNRVNLKHPLQKQGTRDIFWKTWYLCVMGCHSWVVRTLRSTVWPRRHTETFIGNFKLYHSIFYIRPNLIEGHLVHWFFLSFLAEVIQKWTTCFSETTENASVWCARPLWVGYKDIWST